MAIIVRLDEVMSNRKIKLLELADKIGITYANLSNLKNSKVNAIRFSTLESICRELKCQPGDILEYLDDEVLNFIDSFTSNDIQKEGVLNRLYAYASIKGEKNITLELAKECFNFKLEIDIDMILEAVSQYFDIEVEKIKSHTRISKIVYARNIALYLCRCETKVSFKDICSYFDIDAANIMNACDLISTSLNNDIKIQTDYENIMKFQRFTVLTKKRACSII